MRKKPDRNPSAATLQKERDLVTGAQRRGEGEREGERPRRYGEGGVVLCVLLLWRARRRASTT